MQKTLSNINTNVSKVKMNPNISGVNTINSKGVNNMNISKKNKPAASTPHIRTTPIINKNNSIALNSLDDVVKRTIEKPKERIKLDEILMNAITIELLNTLGFKTLGFKKFDLTTLGFKTGPKIYEFHKYVDVRKSLRTNKDEKYKKNVDMVLKIGNTNYIIEMNGFHPVGTTEITDLIKADKKTKIIIMNGVKTKPNCKSLLTCNYAFEYNVLNMFYENIATRGINNSITGNKITDENYSKFFIVDKQNHRVTANNNLLPGYANNTGLTNFEYNILNCNSIHGCNTKTRAMVELLQPLRAILLDQRVPNNKINEAILRMNWANVEETLYKCKEVQNKKGNIREKAKIEAKEQVNAKFKNIVNNIVSIDGIEHYINSKGKAIPVPDKNKLIDSRTDYIIKQRLNSDEAKKYLISVVNNYKYWED